MATKVSYSSWLHHDFGLAVSILLVVQSSVWASTWRSKLCIYLSVEGCIL